MPEPLILTDQHLRTPPDRAFWTSAEMYDPEKMYPTWSLSEVAKMFGYRRNWLRTHLLDGSNVSAELGTVEPLYSAAGHRAFRLYDIERLAHVFAENKIIQSRTLEIVVTLVRTYAMAHDFIAKEPRDRSEDLWVRPGR